MERCYPRIVFSSLRGGAGKTTISVAVVAALQKRGIDIIPFKKGPDYIDAAWLALAASKPCYNLDSFLMRPEQVARSFSRRRTAGSWAVIEGNRGLYDGVDSAGAYSTAELAKLVKAPVILILDCDKVTRTAAAMVRGCQCLDPEVDIRGVILNRVSGSRHSSVIARAVQDSCGLPVFGAIRRRHDFPLLQRHLGLVPPQEHDNVAEVIRQAVSLAEDELDLDGIIRIAQSAASWKDDAFIHREDGSKTVTGPVSIGIIRDRAFQFYYQENIEALVDCGARIVDVSAIDDKVLPRLDALYIGGGFPESHARALSSNEGFRRSLREAAEGGLPIYAECGGLMYLGDSLVVGDKSYPMVGALPVVFGMEKRPQGHGYTVAEVVDVNPFFPVGMRMSGHEFHYSRILSTKREGVHTAYRLLKGTGIGENRDALCRKNILAAFTHLHALGTPQWADLLVEKARQHRITTTKSRRHCSWWNNDARPTDEESDQIMTATGDSIYGAN